MLECNIKLLFRQFGLQRPAGVNILLAGNEILHRSSRPTGYTPTTIVCRCVWAGLNQQIHNACHITSAHLMFNFLLLS